MSPAEPQKDCSPTSKEKAECSDKAIDCQQESQLAQVPIEELYSNCYNTWGKVLRKRAPYAPHMVRHLETGPLQNFFYCLFLFFFLYVVADWVSPDYPELRDSMPRLPLRCYLKHWIMNDALSFIPSWTLLILISLLVYPLSRLTYKSVGVLRFLSINLYVLYAGFFIYSVMRRVQTLRSAPLSTVVISLEGVRLLMKIHSFYRENIRLEDVEGRKFPQIYQLLYFFFAPTLLYRDKYPLNNNIRWWGGMKNLSIYVCLILLGYILLEKVLIPQVLQLMTQPFDLSKMIILTIKIIVPANLLVLSLAWGFLHFYLEGFALLLRFGDRMFYTDWWSMTDYSFFYKTWNVIVYDWLRTYILLDLRKVFPKRLGNAVAGIVVISLSAISHELIFSSLTFSFCPAMLVLFGLIGGVLKFVRTQAFRDNPTAHSRNFMMWVSFFIGNGIFSTIYMCETYISHSSHCPKEFNSFYDYLTPRFLDFQCYGKKLF